MLTERQTYVGPEVGGETGDLLSGPVQIFPQLCDLYTAQRGHCVQRPTNKQSPVTDNAARPPLCEIAVSALCLNTNANSVSSVLVSSASEQTVYFQKYVLQSCRWNVLSEWHAHSDVFIARQQATRADCDIVLPLLSVCPSRPVLCLND